MSHIRVPEGLPGLVGLMTVKPAAGAKVADLLHELFCGDGPLSRTERELIAAYVSALNSCESCPSHSGSDDHLGDAGLGPEAGAIDPRLRALLRLAAAVTAGGACVTEEDIAAARTAGSDDEEIHDTVLLAATICMISRYVDGLDADSRPDDVCDQLDGELAGRDYRTA